MTVSGNVWLWCISVRTLSKERALNKLRGFRMPRYGGVQRVTHLDVVVMEVRVGQKLIGGVVHVRSQKLTH